MKQKIAYNKYFVGFLLWLVWILIGMTGQVKAEQVIDKVKLKGDCYYMEEDGGDIQIVAIRKGVKKPVIPNKVDGKKVTEICWDEECIEFYKGERNIHTLNIPRYVDLVSFSEVKIKNYKVNKKNKYYCAQAGCLYSKDKRKLIRYPNGRQEKSFTIPKGTVRIGSSAFLYSPVEEVSMPNSVKLIENEAFLGAKLKSIRLSSKLREIGDKAFCATDIQSIVFPESLKRIGDAAFWNCKQLKTVMIPKKNHLYLIWYDAFYGCSQLKEFIYPNPIVAKGDHKSARICEGVFEYCTRLEKIELPSNIKNEGRLMFKGCTALESITINGEKSIYDSRDNCNAIIKTKSATLVIGCKNTTIPNSVKRIAPSAFSNCSGLERIIVPKMVKQISDTSFYGCRDLKSITVDSGNAVYDSRDNCNAVIETKTGTLIVGCQNTRIPNGVTSIGKLAFAYRENIESMTIPDSVTSIGEEAFAYCTDLKSIVIPDSVTNIEDYAFVGCRNLKSIFIPDSVTNIGYRAFSGCEVDKIIYGDSGSYAEAYAVKEHIPFQKLLIQTSTTTSSIGLKWKQDSGASYDIYRSTKKTGDYQKIATVSGNSYIDEDLKDGMTYYYKICPLTTEPTAIYKIKAATKPKATKIFLKTGKNKIKISWKKVKGAEKYEVYLSTAKNGRYKKVVVTNQTKYTQENLKKGKTYYVKVRSYITNGNGQKCDSEYSNIKSVKVK